MRSGPEWPGGFYCLWLGNETPHKLGMELGSAQTRAGWGVAQERESALPAKSQSRPLSAAPVQSTGSPRTALCPCDCLCPGAPCSYLGALPMSQARSPGGDAQASRRTPIRPPLPSPPVILLPGVLYYGADPDSVVSSSWAILRPMFSNYPSLPQGALACCRSVDSLYRGLVQPLL